MTQQNQDLNNTYQYFQSELNRIQTIAGTLSTIENEHVKELTNREDDKLNQLAMEGQSAARQLGEVKQICLAMIQKLNELQDTSQTH